MCVLLASQSSLHAEWLTNKSRYSYEDYREARIRQESGRYQRYSKNNYTERAKQPQTSHKRKTPKKITPKTVTQSKNKTPRYKKYIIKKGDTLLGIAHKHNCSHKKISEVNRLKNHDRIYAGMTLKIPTAEHAQTKSDVKNKKHPSFNWPIRKVISYKRDGGSGIRSIGLIIKGKPNTGVFPAATGVVKKIGEMRGFGRYIVVIHNNRYATVYSNLHAVYVHSGDAVKTDTPIGNLSTSTLHFQIDFQGKPCNPLNYLPRKS